LTSFVVDEAVAVFLHFNLYADGEETQNSWLMETSSCAGEDDAPVDAWMRPSSRNRGPFLRHQVVCAHLDPEPLRARPTGATITVRRPSSEAS
jgi:hypothetical protein